MIQSGRARSYKDFAEAVYLITGVTGYGIPKAIYLNDPDNNGVELYRDRPKYLPPLKGKGSIYMVTDPLDPGDLLQELPAQLKYSGFPSCQLP